MTGRLTLDALDQIFVALDDHLRDEDRAGRAREELLRAAYAHHLDRNPGYRRYAERLGADLDAAAVELQRIPLLPSGLFKRDDLELASVPAEEIVKRCTSSGTSGSRSVVPRDEETLMRFLGSVTSSIPALFGIERAGGHAGIVLGPTTEEAGDLWFSYVIACLTLMMRASYFETAGAFDAAGAARAVRARLGAREPLVLIGPPARVLELLDRLEQEGPPPPWVEGSFVISAGGWKGAQARSIDPAAFRGRVRAALGLASEAPIRDSFNMVELNTVINECERHQKHVPPWVSVTARDPVTDAPLPDGEVGVLAFLDATATSYPGFILSEDFGRVRRGPCPCGRAGQRVEFVRRINRIESRGCALKMAAGRAERAELEGHHRFYASVHRNPALHGVDRRR